MTASRGPTDWRGQLAAQIRTLDDLALIFPTLNITTEMRLAATKYPFAVTPYYLSLVEEPSQVDPIFRQCIPDASELEQGPFRDDELEEFSSYSPRPGLIHRYPDRVVVVASTTCPVYCRHCTRKRIVGQANQLWQSEIDQQVEYVRQRPEIKDVIISGGEPLMMTTDALDRILRKFRSVPSVEIIRIGTRVPVTLPMRIDKHLCETLEQHGPIWVNTHFNHPREITAESAAACDMLLRHGIPVNNQSVLLRGVNDSPAVMEELCRALLRIRVRPYYILQCDPVAGTEHFRTNVAKGEAIMRHLFKNVGGIGVPRFVVDAINGGGKMPISPEYIVRREKGKLILGNYDGIEVEYPDPT